MKKLTLEPWREAPDCPGHGGGDQRKDWRIKEVNYPQMLSQDNQSQKTSSHSLRGSQTRMRKSWAQRGSFSSESELMRAIPATWLLCMMRMLLC